MGDRYGNSGRRAVRTRIRLVVAVPRPTLSLLDQTREGAAADTVDDAGDRDRARFELTESQVTYFKTFGF
jgi:hypothetical protein